MSGTHRQNDSLQVIMHMLASLDKIRLVLCERFLSSLLCAIVCHD